VSVKVGGRERRVLSLDVVNVGAVAAPAVAAAGGLPAPFGFTGAPTSGVPRHVLLLVDEGTLFGLDQVFKDAVAKLLASLGPLDRVGIVSTRPGGINITPTTRHAAVREAADAMVLGRGNTSLCIGALIGQVHGLAQVLPRGRASTLAVISRGSSSRNPGERGGFTSGGANCGFRLEELRPVADQIAAAQINYLVFHAGASGLGLSLDNFAGATGADTGVLSFTDATGLARAIASVTRFYRAAIDADPAGRGEPQRLDVRVSRPGMKVKAPAQLSLAPLAARRVDAGALLRGDASRSDLPLRVAAYASRHDGPLPAKLVVVVEPVARDARLTEAMLAVVGADGDVVGQWTARRSDLERVPMIAAVPVAPGTYRVRAAALDDAGRGGTAEYETSAALAGAGPVKMSALVLGVTGDAGLVPRLVFSTEPAATAYLEVYDAPPSAAVSVTVELASSLTGPAIASAAGKVSAGRLGRMVTASLPVAGLPAGDTLVRARVTVDGVEAGQVLSTLRKAPTPR
jgi:hypothetical protein